MKDIYEVLRQKELDLSRVGVEVEALRVATQLLSEDQELNDDGKRDATASTLSSRPIRMQQAVNASPQSEGSSHWEERGKSWP
jgi:hypothetical protein